MAFELGFGATVAVEPPRVPTLTMAAPVSSPVAVLPVAGPPGPPGEPGLPGDVTALAYQHVQDTPATVWLITHGLPFRPSGIEVLDHVGNRHYPQLSYSSAGLVRLDFLDSIRGTADLS